MTFFRTAAFSEADLIAFHMDELSPHRRRALQRAITANPALAAESASIAATLSAFKYLPVPAFDPATSARVWQSLRPSLLPHLPASPLPGFLRSSLRLPLLAGGLAAAVIAVSVAYRLQHPLPANSMPAPSSVRTQTAAGGASARPFSSSAAATRLQAAPPVSAVPAASGRHRVASAALFSTVPVPVTPLAHRAFPAVEIPLAPVTVASLDFLPLATSPALSLPAPGQPSSPPVPSSRTAALHRSSANRKSHFPPEADVWFAGGGTFIATRTLTTPGAQPISQTAIHALSALAAFHQQFRPALGYRVTVSYTRPDFNYGSTSTSGVSYQSGEVNTAIYELAGTYVVRGPHRRRLSTSADAGAALLAFLPTAATQGPNQVFRAAAVAGVNADLALPHHWGLRAAFRAQLFKTPDFRYTNGSLPITAALTVDSAPSVGITYRFGTTN